MAASVFAFIPPAMVGVGLIALVAAFVVAVRVRRRAFGAAPVDAGDLSAPPGLLYHAGLVLTIVGVGWEVGLAVGAVVLVVMLVAVVRMWRAAGVALAGDELVFGTGAGRVGIPLELIGGVVSRPRSWLGPAAGTFGIADDEGEWLAVVRWQSAPLSAQVLASVIARRGLASEGSGVWRDPQMPLPTARIPSFGI